MIKEEDNEESMLQEAGKYCLDISKIVLGEVCFRG